LLKNRVLLLGLGLIVATLVALSGCGAPSQTPTGGLDLTFIITMAVIFAVFYFLVMRPQRRRQKEQQRMQQELKKGDKVITAGGIYGVVDSTSEDTVVIKVESGALLRVVRASVVSVRE